MMANYDWLNKEDFAAVLSQEQRDILNALGLETYLAMCEKLEKRRAMVFTKGSPLSKARRRYVIQNFDGSNAKELARKLGVTSRTVYNYVREHRESVKAARRSKDS